MQCVCCAFVKSDGVILANNILSKVAHSNAAQLHNHAS